MKTVKQVWCSYLASFVWGRNDPDHSNYCKAFHETVKIERVA